FDARRGCARPEDGDARVPELVGEARDERRFRPDDDEVDLVLAAEREQALPILGADGVAVPDRRNARVAGGGVQLVAPSALRQFPGERVLAAARAHHENLHASSVSKGSERRILSPWSNPASIGTSGRRSGRRSSRWSSTHRRRHCPRSIAWWSGYSASAATLQPRRMRRARG